MEHAIVVENVTKRFKETVAVNQVTVCFEKGKIHGIIGRNGSGKTVLFKCICGLFPVTEGRIKYWGRRWETGSGCRRGVGAIIETPGFLPNCSGYQNLRYLMELSGKADKEKIREAITLGGPGPGQPEACGKYSMGMRQRLGLAQAIMEDPELLILDEPMNGLDKNGVEEMRSCFLKLKEQGKTILIASPQPGGHADSVRYLHEMDAGVMTEREILK